MGEAGRGGGSPTWWAWAGEKGVALFWAALAACIVLYGNGEHDLLSLVLFSPRLSRPLVTLALGCWAVNLLLFLYVYIWLQWVKALDRPLDTFPWVPRAGATCFAIAFVSMTLGIWPVFDLLSPVIVVVVTYGAILGLHFVPHLGLMQPLGPLGGPGSGGGAQQARAHAD